LLRFRLIIKLSFELIFWILLDSKLNCSHFQLNSSWIEHIFNSIQLDSTRNRANSTQFAKNLNLASRELNIEIFPVFCFCIIFLHYLFDRESWRETWRLFGREPWREVMVGSHDGETWRSFDFGREPWRGNMVGSHKEKPWRLFDQAIVLGFNFSTRPDTFPKKFQPDPTRSVYWDRA